MYLTKVELKNLHETCVKNASATILSNFCNKNPSHRQAQLAMPHLITDQ